MPIDWDAPMAFPFILSFSAQGVGSVVPGLGTLVGGIVGAGVGVVGGSLTPSFFGDYLRYIG